MIALLFTAVWYQFYPAIPHMDTSDLFTHLSVARHLLQGDGFVTDITYPLSFAYEFAWKLPQPLIHRGPGYALLLTAAVAPSPDDPALVVTHVRWMQLVFLGLWAGLGTVAFLRRKNILAGGIWLVLLGLSPLLVFAVNWAFVELPAGLLLLVLWLRHRDINKAGPGWIDGVLLGALTLLRVDLFWLPLLWWFWGRLELKNFSRHAPRPAIWNRRLLMALLMVVLINLPWAVRTTRLTGNPFFTLQGQAELLKDTSTFPGYSVYKDLEPHPIVKVMKENPIPVMRKFARGVRFFFSDLARLFPWEGLVIMALALMMYLRGGIRNKAYHLQPGTEYPMSIVPAESPLGPLVVSGLTLILLIFQYSFFDHNLRHLLVIFPIVGWELSGLLGSLIARAGRRFKIKTWMLIAPTILAAVLFVKVSQQPLPGWEKAARSAKRKESFLAEKIRWLALNPDPVPFEDTSAAPWYADRAAVWDPHNEETRNIIREKLSQATFADSLVSAALERTQHQVVYDGAYQSIAYPDGDVADDRGVCTDLIIRSFRALGIDLQKLVHEDMLNDFAAYPNLWNLNHPDANIDHRRVPNLQMYFKRRNLEIPATTNPEDYEPGDLVTWMLPGNLPHIGIVARKKSTDEVRPLVIHNVGQGPRQEDFLLDFPITGHYRYQR